MATKKQQEQKKKQRERESYQKVLRRREGMRLSRKLAENEELQRQEIELLAHGKLKPIIRDPIQAAEINAIRDQTITEKLKRNLEILEALEQEYDEENARRTAVNEKLEAEGFISMREKMDALHQKALEITGKSEELAAAYTAAENK